MALTVLNAEVVHIFARQKEGWHNLSEQPEE
jgi:hypothetical protein